MKQEAYVDKKRRRHQKEQGKDGRHRVPPPTTKFPELNLHQLHQRHRQKRAAADGAGGRRQNPYSQQLQVHAPAAMHHIGVHHRTVAAPNGQLEGRSDETGEEEGAEGVDVRLHKMLAGGGAGGARGGADEAVLGVSRVQGDADEGGEREQ